ncbi:hypothetical protein K523DRAFT_286400 [Schizophyllum commune Tattone D]|nr:hypothetical protein K523DRAFT_286400 [Schizophyllum commune Tattone D]
MSSPLPSWNAMREPTSSSVADEEETTSRSNPNNTPASTLEPTSRADRPRPPPPTRLQPRDPNRSAAVTRPTHRASQPARISSDEEDEIPPPLLRKRKARGKPTKERGSESVSARGGGSASTPSETFRDLFGAPALAQNASGAASSKATQSPASGAPQPVPTTICAPSTSTSVPSRTQPPKEPVGWSSGRSQTVLGGSSRGPVESATVTPKTPATAPGFKTTDSSRKPLSRPPPTPSKPQIQQEVIDLVTSEEDEAPVPTFGTSSTSAATGSAPRTRGRDMLPSATQPAPSTRPSTSLSASARQERSSSRRHSTQLQPASTSQLDSTQPPFASLSVASSSQPFAQAPTASQPSQRGRHRQIIDIDDAGRGVSRKKEPPPSDREVISISDDDEKKDEEIVITGTRNAPFKGAKQPTRDRNVEGKGRAKTSLNSDPRKPSPSSRTAKYRRTTRSSKYEPDSDIEIIDPPPSTSASGKGGGKGKETERQHREKSVERSGNGKDPLARDGRTSSRSQPPEHLFPSAAYEEGLPFLPEPDIEELPPLPEDDDDEPMTIDASVPIDDKLKKAEDSMSVDEPEPLPVQSGFGTTLVDRPDDILMEDKDDNSMSVDPAIPRDNAYIGNEQDSVPAAESAPCNDVYDSTRQSASLDVDQTPPHDEEDQLDSDGHRLNPPLPSRPSPGLSSARHAVSVNRSQSVSATSASAPSDLAAEAKTLSAVTPCGARNAMATRRSAADFCDAQLSTKGNASRHDTSPSTSDAGPSCSGRSLTSGAVLSTGDKPSASSGSGGAALTHSTPVFESYDDDELYANSDKEEVTGAVSDGGKGKGRANQHKLDSGKLKEREGNGGNRALDTDELTTRTTALSISPSASQTTSTPASGPIVSTRRPSIAKDSVAVAPVFTSVWPAKSAVAPAHSFLMHGPWMSTTWMQPQQQQPAAIAAMKASNNAASSSGMTMATSSTLRAAMPSAPGSVTQPFDTDTSPLLSTNDTVELIEGPALARKRSRVPSASPSRPAPAERNGATGKHINEPPARSSPTVLPMASRVATPSKSPILHIDLRTLRQNNLGSTPLKLLSTPSKVAAPGAEETDKDDTMQRAPTHSMSLLHGRTVTPHGPSPPLVEACPSMPSTKPSAEQVQGPQETVDAQENQSLTADFPLAGPIVQLASIGQCAPTASNDSDEEFDPIPYYGKRKRASTTSDSTPAPADKSNEDAGRSVASKGKARAVEADNHTVSGDEGEYSEAVNDDANAESSDNQSSVPESEPRPAYPRYSKPVARKSAGGRLPRLRLPSTTIDASSRDTNSDLHPSSSAPRAAPPLPSRWNRVRPVARKSTGGKPPVSSSVTASILSSAAHPATIRYPSSDTKSDIDPRDQGDLAGAINNNSTPSPKPPPHKRRRVEAKEATTGPGRSFQPRATVAETISLLTSDEEGSTSNSPPRVHNSDDGDAESVAHMLESTPPTTNTAPNSTASAGNGVMQTARKIVGAACNVLKEPYNAVKGQVLGVVHYDQRSSEGESSRPSSSEPSTRSVDERAQRNRSNPDPFASAGSESDFQGSAGDDSEGPSTQRRNLRRRRKTVNYAEIPPSVEQDSDGTQSIRARSPERSDDSTSHQPPPLPSRMRRVHVMTWAKRVQELRKEPPPYFKSKNIPHRLEDSVNYMSLRERNQTHAMGPVYWALAFSHASVFNDDGIRFMLEECIKDADREERLPGSAGPLPPPMRIINEVDGDATPPWEFHYSNVMWHGKHVPKPNRKDRVGCGCIGDCSSNRYCACLKEQRRWTETWGLKGFAYDKDKRLIIFEQLPVFECNELCGCDDNCRNRVVQHGRRMPLLIKKTKHKGWGVFNGAKKIRSGEFIGIYAGELLDERESHRRGLKYNRFGRTYLLDLDFWWCRRNDRTQAPQPKPGPHAKEDSPGGKAKKKGRTRKQSSQDPEERPEEELAAEEEDDAPGWEPLYTVDAYHAGNFTRFFNHSCDPNLITTGVYVSEANVDKPLVCFFACRDIAPDEELTFNYRGADDDGPQDGPATVHSDEVYAKCLCGAANCTGTMFNSR